MKIHILLLINIIFLSCNSNSHSNSINSDNSNLRRDSLFEPLSKDILSSFYHDTLNNYLLKNKEVESTSGYGYRINTILGYYEKINNPEKKVKLYLSDAGGTKSILGIGAWASVDFNKSNEFTQKINGKKFYLKINNKNNKGEVNVLLNNRFVIQLKSRNIDSSEMLLIVNDFIKNNEMYFEVAK